MEGRTSLIKVSSPLVADTSAAINLIATGSAPDILRVLPVRVVAVDTVAGELELGRVRGRGDADRFQELVSAGFVEVVQLGDTGAQHFEGLVVGIAAETLDDVEAATIAYALEQNGTALIDERKATSLCGARFPRLRLCSTADILLHPEVMRQLGAEMLVGAVFNALINARMGVPPEHLEDIVRLIGTELAATCPSLPRVARMHRTIGTDETGSTRG
jgi:predicted nucleic acid-binding protein